MQKIKFRCWDKNKKQMRAVRDICFDQYGTIDVYCECDDINEPAKGNDSLMQFTGLLDRNGKEIYEGDIVEWKYLQTWHKNEVRWVGGEFVVTTSGFKDDLNEPQNLSLVSILNCEIIGNIYENPELLNPHTT